MEDLVGSAFDLATIIIVLSIAAAAILGVIKLVKWAANNNEDQREENAHRRHMEERRMNLKEIEATNKAQVQHRQLDVEEYRYDRKYDAQMADIQATPMRQNALSAPAPQYTSANPLGEDVHAQYARLKASHQCCACCARNHGTTLSDGINTLQSHHRLEPHRCRQNVGVAPMHTGMGQQAQQPVHQQYQQRAQPQQENMANSISQIGQGGAAQQVQPQQPQPTYRSAAQTAEIVDMMDSARTRNE